MMARAGLVVAICAAAWSAGLRGSSAATFTSFDIPGMDWTIARSINAKGDIAGDCGRGFKQQGFVRWADGTIALFGFNATGINDSGVAVGFVSHPAGDDWGLVRAVDGRISKVIIPGADVSLVGINASGVALGNYSGSQGAASFIRTPDGQIQTFSVPGSAQTTAFGINQRGDITGAYLLADNALHGFLRTAEGTFTTFDMPGATYGTWPKSINDRGWIVGYYMDGNDTHGFQRSPNGTLTVIDSPNGSGVLLAAFINARDMTVGYFGIGDTYTGFTLSHRGKLGLVRVPKRHDDSVVPYAININGDIVGGYYDSDSEHAFMRSP